MVVIKMMLSWKAKDTNGDEDKLQHEFIMLC
jgi:hypothetical protein